ncbi:MAG: NAD(P)/FAD-dependent oxidoreductase [Acutalibacteraceae bacterium]|nr:FAD-dependent monooxygenase [Oscillospiraceae bacterium]
MKGKIIVVGANQCALAFAYLACKKGFEVKLYEKEKKENVAYPWTDDVAKNTFEEADLPFPPENVYRRTDAAAFVMPNNALIAINTPEEDLDYSLLRRPLNAWLEELAVSEGAKVEYEKEISHAITIGDEVIGVVFANGDVERADLVVDCGGMSSPVRSSLPDCFDIPQSVDPNDYFFVKRIFFDRPEGSPDPEQLWKVYLRHRGENGISWCRLSHDKKSADVLIGRTRGLDSETYDAALADLKADNPIIGDTFDHSTDMLCKIPVRNTFSKIFSKGYVLLGDSACMTIPLIGSGIASGLKAARNLAETLDSASGDPFSKENLYRYQYRYMKESGAVHAMIHIIKNALLKVEPEIISRLANPELVKSVVLTVSGGGKDELVKNLLALAKNDTRIFIGVVKKVTAAVKAGAVTLAIPKEYDEKKFSLWRRQYEKATDER